MIYEERKNKVSKIILDLHIPIEPVFMVENMQVILDRFKKLR